MVQCLKNKYSLKGAKLQVLHLMLGTGSMQIANVAVFIALARWLPLHDFGIWRQLFLIHQVLVALVFAAFPMSLLYFCGRADTDDKKIVIRRHLVAVMAVGTMSTIVLIAAAKPLAWILDAPTLEPHLRLFSVYPAAYMVYSLVAPTMLTQGRTSESAAFSVLLALLGSLPILIAAYVGLPLVTVVQISVASAVVAACLAALVIIKSSTTQINKKSCISAPQMSEVYAYLWPLLLASGIGLIGLRMDHFVVSHNFGQSIYAMYAVGAFEIPLFAMLQSSVSSVLLSKFSKLSANREWAAISVLWRTALEQSAIIAFPVAAVLIVLAKPFIIVVFGMKFVDATPVFQSFLLLAPIRVMTFGLVLRASGRTKPDLVGGLGYLVIVTILATVGAQIMGPIGAALAVVFCTASLAFWLAWLTRRLTNGEIKISHMYPPRLLFIFAIMILMAYTLLSVLMPLAVILTPIMQLLIGAVICCLVITFGLYKNRNKPQIISI